MDWVFQQQMEQAFLFVWITGTRWIVPALEPGVQVLRESTMTGEHLNQLWCYCYPPNGTICVYSIGKEYFRDGGGSSNWNLQFYLSRVSSRMPLLTNEFGH